jgi:chemotaxis protein methyltransferase CheR
MKGEISNDDYRRLLDSIYHQYGYDFTEYAESSVKRRILHFMNGREICTSDELLSVILGNESTFEEFVQELSVTVTEMFRDPAFFKEIREKVASRLATYPVIKIWIAGCATGQEIYSMAILLKEEGLLDRSIIYATDINQKSLMTAREGMYAMENMKTYTQNYLLAGGKRPFSDYYTAKYNLALFDKSLKNNIVFSPHNLVSDQSFNEFQFIICRNVLMYFNQHLQNKVTNLFYESLCTFGFLGLGDKESLLFSDKKDHFEKADDIQKIFRKIK